MLKQIVLLVSSSMKLSQVMLGNATVGIRLYAEVLYSHTLSVFIFFYFYILSGIIDLMSGSYFVLVFLFIFCRLPY